MTESVFDAPEIPTGVARQRGDFSCAALNPLRERLHGLTVRLLGWCLCDWFGLLGCVGAKLLNISLDRRFGRESLAWFASSWLKYAVASTRDLRNVPRFRDFVNSRA